MHPCVNSLPNARDLPIRQLLSFPLSSSGVMTWRATGLRPFAKFLGYLSLQTLGDDHIEAAACYVCLSVAVVTLAVFAYVGYFAVSARTAPFWISQVCAQMYFLLCFEW